jgi:SAM-dependent methyltransferase
MHIHPDIAELRRFYSSDLGEAVRRDLSRALHRHWGNVAGLQMVGLGFALPYLGHYLPQAHSVLALMLPHMGAMYWPTSGANHSVLMDQSAFPLRDESVDRVLAIHAIEHSGHLHTMMQEIYRILRIGGRALFVVPNRTGLWSSHKNNPFGYGYPYYRMQLQHRGELAGLTLCACFIGSVLPPHCVARCSLWRTHHGIYGTMHLATSGRGTDSGDGKTTLCGHHRIRHASRAHSNDKLCFRCVKH